MTNLEFQNFDVETKQDSAEKLAAIAGQPTYNFVFSPEFNKIVDAIKFIRDNFGPQNLQQVLENGQTYEVAPPSGFDYVRIRINQVGFFIEHQITSEGIPKYTALGAGGLVHNSDGSTFVVLEPQLNTDGSYVPSSVYMPETLGYEIMATREWANILIANVINQLINGAPEDANTLKELNDKIVALQSIVGGTALDGDSIVNTLNEVLAVFQSYSEGVDLAVLLNSKVNTTDVVNNLNQLVAGKVLDARQGKVLADLIAAKWTAVDATNLIKGIMKLYNGSGNNTDGGVDQKFFTETVLARKGIENANYTILATDKIVTTAAAFTANRTFTLPGDAPAGKEIIIADEFGAVGTYTLTIQVPSGKKLNGVINGTEVIQYAYGWRRPITDGNGNWFFDAGIVRQQQLALKQNSFVKTDTSSTSTIVGHSAFTTREIIEIDCGTHLDVYFFLDGTGNATNYTFTISSPASNTTSQLCRVRNNSSSYVSAAVVATAGSNVLTIFSTVNGGAFTGSGTRSAIGQIRIIK